MSGGTPSATSANCAERTALLYMDRLPGNFFTSQKSAHVFGPPWGNLSFR